MGVVELLNFKFKKRLGYSLALRYDVLYMSYTQGEILEMSNVSIEQTTLIFLIPACSVVVRVCVPTAVSLAS